VNGNAVSLIGMFDWIDLFAGGQVKIAKTEQLQTSRISPDFGESPSEMN